MAVLRERMLGTLGIIVFTLLLWSSALLPLPFRVGIDRPLRMRFEYPMTELRVVVDSDASTSRAGPRIILTVSSSVH